MIIFKVNIWHFVFMESKTFVRSALFSLTSVAIIASCTPSYNIVPVFNKIDISDTDYEIGGTTIRLESSSDVILRQIKPLNDRLVLLRDTLSEALVNGAHAYFSSYDSALKRHEVEFPRPNFKFELYLTDTLYVASEKIISTMTIAYFYTGGAHGHTEFYALNYAPDKSRFYTIHDILDTTQQNRINKLLKDYFVNESDCFTIAPTIDKVTAVNVTSKSVLFTFAHYILGPYYCGAPTIEVPLIELKGIYKL